MLIYGDHIVAAVMILYVLVGISYTSEGKIGLAVAFFAYALANVGLILTSRGH